MEYMSSIQSLWTLVAFIVFVGIVIWAWSSKRDHEFDEAAHLIFDENEKPDNHQSKLGN